MDSVLDEAEHSMGEIQDLIFLESSDVNDIVGEPHVAPRIGDDYQARIPPLLTETEHLQLLRNPFEAGKRVDVSHSFLLGLPVPITWISEAKTIKHEPVGGINDSTVAACSNGNGPVNSVNDAKGVSSLKEDQDFKVNTSNHLPRNSTSFPVPGLPVEYWSEFEVDCFLLGLYIFGKNLLQVERFMGRKHMGKILPFYYGRFYGSPRYCRWSDCRKMKNKKCIVGQKLFSGGRQQELFSRLLPHLSEESKSTLQEKSKAYAEGRTSTEDYVATLKSMVGLHILVEAVGIGKGKEDLTTLAGDTSKNAHIFTSHPEIPSGNACSSLTCAEIIKFLTGGFRLSKARSNDLFWEAVWPRLLAKGWHSEKPKNECYKGAKSCLVFLMPGVKKFSRRKLVKGGQYFDSVSDVLNKIASEPGLLELEAGETQDSTPKADSGWAAESSSDSDGNDDSDHESCRYLKPRVTPSTGNLMKFTIVDTSLGGDGEKSANIWQMRGLPIQAKSTPVLKNRCIEMNGILSRESDKEPVTRDVQLHNLKYYINATDTVDLANGKLGSQNTASDSPKPSNGSLENLGDHDSTLSHDQHSRTIKHQFSRRPKGNHPYTSSPALKRRKILSCTVVASTTPLAGLESHRAFSSPAQERDTASAASSLTEMSVVDCLAASSLEEKSQKCRDICTLEEHDNKQEAQPAVKAEQYDNKQEAHLPVMTKLGTVVQIKAEAENECCSQTPPVSSESLGVTEQKKIVSGRRQSTRIRPLTTRALEALEVGLLSPKQTRKRQRACSLEDKKPRVSGQPHVRNTGSASSSLDEGTNSWDRVYNGVSDGIGQKLSQRSGSPIIPHIRNSDSANCSINSGTESGGSGYNKACYDMAQTHNQKPIPGGIHVRKMKPVNCSVGEGAKAEGSIAYDKVSMFETLGRKSWPSDEAQVSNSKPANCFIGERAEHEESAYAKMLNIVQTFGQKSKPSSHFLVGNSEAANCNVAESVESKSNGFVMGFRDIVHTLDSESQPYGVPHVGDTSNAKCSVREDMKSDDNGNARVWHSIVETLSQKPRPSNQHVRNIESGTCTAGEGAVSGSSSIYVQITPGGLVQTLSQKSFPPVQPGVRNTNSANCSTGKGTASGGSESDKVAVNRVRALDRKSLPAVQPQVRNSEPAKCSSGQVKGSGGSGYDDIYSSITDKPKQKTRPSGRSVKKKGLANQGAGESTESNRVSSSMAQALNNPLFQANQQVARELFGFTRPSKYLKP